MDAEIKYIDLQEFRESGFLQEANRLFFHPRGLAMSVEVDDDGHVTALGGIWDYREDAEGITYGDDQITQEKAELVETERIRHLAVRSEMFGGSVQPVNDREPW